MPENTARALVQFHGLIDPEIEGVRAEVQGGASGRDVENITGKRSSIRRLENGFGVVHLEFVRWSVAP